MTSLLLKLNHSGSGVPQQMSPIFALMFHIEPFLHCAIAELFPIAYYTVFAGEFRVDKTYKAQMFRRVSVLRPLSQRLCTPPAVPAGDAVLRFSYVGVIDPASLKTTHPAERKVTLEVRVADLPLTTDAQRERLLGLVGPRFNASKGVLKLTSERYPTMGENKAYLRSVLDELLAEARRT